MRQTSVRTACKVNVVHPADPDSNAPGSVIVEKQVAQLVRHFVLEGVVIFHEGDKP
ncbi:MULTISPECIES: hypothetical protein [unclassified Bradyrhizobium]|uniref:hypothetical protein n=1 Tax=unclassified Bradyrhizobium TaxID=2631580 RepID=UPI001CD294B1|nr:MULTISPECIES: hypothetical protein [unclassified Bradyrhizobium]MCA1378615.1 hypothetical protein [Bradyrhizobium sp. IC4060]MCA1488438.1 hypothetical protein [Bradyrhizobium sp. IC4061]